MVFGVALSDETIEVPVDNAPKPTESEKNVYERVNELKLDADKLETEIKTKSEAFAAEEKKIGKETEAMKKRIEKKQQSLDIWNKELKRMHSRIEELKAEVAQLEKRARARRPSSTVFWVIARVYLLKAWTCFITFWNSNQYTQAVQSAVVKYGTICINYVVTFWNTTAYPTLMRLYEPYAPKVNEVIASMIAAVKKYGMIAYSWTVEKLALQYELMKNTKFVKDYADVLMYITLVLIFNALWHAALLVLAILTFPLRCLCPCCCRKCCCKNCKYCCKNCKCCDKCCCKCCKRDKCCDKCSDKCDGKCCDKCEKCCCKGCASKN
ncbi:hypothetical protein BLSTO_03972 [Blastocystis sp. subtype 1]